MKKKVFILISISFLIILAVACSENGNKNSNRMSLKNAGIDSLNYVQVSESVVIIQNEKDLGSNMACIALDNGLVFIDCSFFTEIAAEFRRKMEEKYQRKTLALVQSHAHTDHFFGMDAFNDVPYIASAKAEPMFAAQLGIDYEQYKEGYTRIFPKFDKALESAKLRMPDFWFDGELVLGSGKNELRLGHAGGHTAGSIYAYFENEKVIFVGDDIQVDYHLYFGDQTGDINQWIKILAFWEDMEIEKVCGGHGPVTDKDYLTKTRLFLENLQAKLLDLKAAGADQETVLREVNALDNYWPKELEKPNWYDAAIWSVYSRM